jgi:hypothetical protein
MMSKFARVTIVAAAGMLAVAVLATAQTKDPFVGTWTMNVAKSKFDPGPGPKSGTTTYEPAGKGYKITVKSEPSSGAPQQWSYTTDLDGKDAPMTGNPNADAVAVKRVDSHTLEAVTKKGGKELSTQKRVVSADGKTMTVTITGINAQGQKTHNVIVYEKT